MRMRAGQADGRMSHAHTTEGSRGCQPGAVASHASTRKGQGNVQRLMRNAATDWHTFCTAHALSSQCTVWQGARCRAGCVPTNARHSCLHACEIRRGQNGTNMRGRSGTGAACANMHTASTAPAAYKFKVRGSKQKCTDMHRTGGWTSPGLSMCQQCPALWNMDDHQARTVNVAHRASHCKKGVHG